MNHDRRPLIAGNWKMNAGGQDACPLAAAVTKAAREADRAEVHAWSIRMEGFGGPAQPSPTIVTSVSSRFAINCAFFGFFSMTTTS